MKSPFGEPAMGTGGVAEEEPSPAEVAEKKSETEAGLIGNMFRDRAALVQELNDKVAKANALAQEIADLENLNAQRIKEYNTINKDTTLGYDDKMAKLIPLGDQINATGAESREKQEQYDELKRELDKARNLNL